MTLANAERFADEWQRLTGRVLWAHDQEQAKAATLAVAREERVRLVVAHDTPQLAALGLAAALQHECAVVLPPRPEEGEAGRRAFRDAAAQAELGVVWCAAGVAASGTLALLSGRGTPRAASLLPPACLFVVEANAIRPSLTDLFLHLRALGEMPPALNLVSGPSRSGDIEGDLALGVHGPGRVTALILTFAPALGEAAS